MRKSAGAVVLRRLGRVFGWRRLLTAFVLSLIVALPLSQGWQPNPLSLYKRTALLGLAGLIVFGTLEEWPRRLPRGVARWILQVVAVALTMPLGVFLIYVLSTPGGAPSFWEVPNRLEGFTNLTMLSILVAPWGALGGLVRQKEAFAQDQALAFALERSELERQALDVRFRLLQAQVAPHFLFNTLANVQALVEAGSPQAPVVLRHLATYLRAAVPRLDDASTTLRQELGLTRAYLELMHMRMPDRLRFTVKAAEDSLDVECPPMAILTLVENAVRHGIDPCEDGGEIEVAVSRAGAWCQIRVRDTGVGLRPTGTCEGLPGSNDQGTGLATLRERLRLAYRGEAHLRIRATEPHGTCAELVFPASEVSP